MAGSLVAGRPVSMRPARRRLKPGAARSPTVRSYHPAVVGQAIVARPSDLSAIRRGAAW